VPVVATLDPLLSQVGIAILAAAGLAFVARALRQPLVVAYVAAGVLLGQNIGFGIITRPESVRVIASFGLILLLFLIGLEIDVKALRRAGKAVLWAGLLQVPLNTLFALVVPWALRATGAVQSLGPYGALYLGFGLSLSSTLVVVKLLYDKHEIDTTAGRITLGVLVLQDLWAILFLAVQPSLTAPEVGPLALSLGEGVLLVVGAFVASRWVLPILFGGAAKTPELVLLGALAWCFLLAGIASEIKLSAEMGALIAGVSLSVLPYKPDVVAKVTSVRDFFLTLFFVALGLELRKPTLAIAAAAVVTAAFVFLSRFVVCFPILRRLRLGDRNALLVPTNLWPVSEFTLVLTAIGFTAGHVSEDASNVVLMTMIVTAVAGTYAILGSHSLQQRIAAWLARRGWGADTGPKSAILRRPYGVVVLGFHRIASGLLSELQARRPDVLKDVLVVDFNPVVLKELQGRGVASAYGDLSNTDTLRHAGLESARVVVSTVPDSLLKGTTNLRILSAVRTVAPEAKTIVTAETRPAEKEMYAVGAEGVLVPWRAAGESAVEDILALLEGRPPPCRERGDRADDEILQ
jgi:Kef-type K+ transport system membrane component KefB